MNRVIYFIAISFFSGVITFSQAAQIEPDLSLLPAGTNTALLVQPVGEESKPILAYHNQQMFSPASTQKVVTALAALLELGPDFQFVTYMKTDGKIEQGKLKGNLILQMSGDPTLTRQKVSEMLNVLKLKGVSRIEGDIIIDTSIFTSHDKAPGWSWDNLTYCYNTPPSAATIDGNCFYAGLEPTKVGEKAKVTVAAQYPVTLTSQVITTSKESDDKYCELDIIAKDHNHYQLTGCVKQGENKRYFQFAVQDGVDYFTAIFQSLLKQHNLTFTGKFVENKPYDQKRLTPIAVAQSAKLPDLLTEMLKKSNNQIADTVFRTIGHQYFKMSGSWRNGGDAVKLILNDKAGIDLQNSVIVDGSGLSRLNLLSADKMMQILQYIAAHDKELHLIAMLPVSGVDGTLQHRNSVRYTPLKSVIQAKTGYLQGTYNLAGYLTTESGQTFAFVQFITGYSHPVEDEKLTNEAVMKFEEDLYKNLFNKIK
ncbi:serine-type D-Ala-D-Ala carboxypeptidase [Zophobihabitans entericus]|uniref:Serine-type D-Ala-D-Ala carboxypeptidase n=1 Tax=Zophobihabitans entericus TaxID=1635327 RepID=A0A6G9I9U5_9GAMM|nr:serine-type D-Ala-D-Ala carboxypeptidase [Zophobihabitans entericus]QIQ20350.1 serine-type D-Ala-D-Ala carboxypeptidase [Zophobihabitans entericus]